MKISFENPKPEFITSIFFHMTIMTAAQQYSTAGGVGGYQINLTLLKSFSSASLSLMSCALCCNSTQAVLFPSIMYTTEDQLSIPWR